jgi:mono/diheme cytochrome c family protein
MRSRNWIPVLILLATMASAPIALAQEGEGDPDRGGQLYVENCAVCHGVEGQGRIGASLQAFPGIDPGSEVQTVIADGVAGSVMPAWSQARGGPLSQQDIRDLAAYVLQAFGGTEPITPLPTYRAPPIAALPDVEGDPSLGAVVFQENCVMCHGQQGQGRFGVPLAKAWSGTDPETYIRQVVRAGIAGTTMPAWAREAGGPLSEEDVANVTAYVLTLEPAPAPTPAAAPPVPLGATTTLILMAAGLAVLVVILVAYYRRAQPR